MSGLGRLLRESVFPGTYSGSIYGTGTLDLPVGVLAVTVTAAGAPGGNDYVYHPGQLYVAEVPFSVGQPYVPSYFEWTGGFSFSGYIGLTPTVIPPPTALGQTPDPIYAFAYAGQTCYATSSNGLGFVNGVGTPYVQVFSMPAQTFIAPSAGRYYFSPGWYWKATGATQSGGFWSPNGFTSPNIIDPSTWSMQWDCDSRLRTRPTGAGQTLPNGIVGLSKRGVTLQTLTGVASYYFAGQSAIPAVDVQPYIAPWETGGPYSGADTTLTLDGVTETFTGGYAAPATPGTRTLVSDGSGQTLAYTVPAGGAATYSYSY